MEEKRLPAIAADEHSVPANRKKAAALVEPDTMYDVPDEETKKKCLAYSAKLQRNHPTWPPSKNARKVAEHFKLKPLAKQ